jgi:histidine ammonia-lyase
MILSPGHVSLAQWRDIYRRASCALDPAAIPNVARSAEAAAKTLARGDVVYGIDAGFGKRAAVCVAVPRLEDDSYVAPDIAAAIALLERIPLPLETLPGVL